MTQEDDSPSWLRKDPIGPPSAHIAAWIGMLCCGALAYFLSSLGYLSKNMVVVVVAAGYCVPFAIVRELAAKRMQDFLTKMHKLSDEEN